MDNETKNRIEQLRFDGKQIYRKATDIVQHLGELTPKKHGNIVRYNQNHLNIEWDDYGKNMTIKFDEKSVLSVHLGEVELYRPDIEGWKEIFDDVYILALEKIQTKEEEKAEKEKQEIFDKWGIKE